MLTQPVIFIQVPNPRLQLEKLYNLCNPINLSTYCNLHFAKAFLRHNNFV